MGMSGAGIYGRDDRLVTPTSSVNALKIKQNIDPEQWPSLIFSDPTNSKTNSKITKTHLFNDTHNASNKRAFV